MNLQMPQQSSPAVLRQAHEAKRKLCSEYDLFVADERVLPQLPKLLGGLPAC